MREMERAKIKARGVMQNEVELIKETLYQFCLGSEREVRRRTDMGV